MSEIRKFLYSGNVDDTFKGIIVVLLSFCLAQQAQAGSISIRNGSSATGPGLFAQDSPRRNKESADIDVGLAFEPLGMNLQDGSL